MVTKRTRLMSAFAAILMLVSMFTAFVLPVSADAYSKDVNDYPNFPKTSEIGTYTVANGYLHFLIEDLDDLNYVAQHDAAFSAGTTLHLANDITITGPQAAANKITNLYANIDGHGYTIRGGHFDRDKNSGAWITQTKIAGQVIENLTLEGWYAKEVGWQGGLLVYNVEQTLTLRNITVRDSLVTKTDKNGGSALVGRVAPTCATLTMKNITLAGNTLVYNSDNAGLVIGRIGDTNATCKLDMDGIYIYNNTMTGAANNATGLLWGEYNGGEGTIVKNVVAMGNTYSAIKASLGRVKSGSVTFSNIVVKDTGATPVNMVRLYRENCNATVTLGENIFTNATTLVQDDAGGGNTLGAYAPATEAQTEANANVCDFSDMSAITTALGAGWGLSKVYTDAEGNGYPIQTAHEGEDPNLTLAKEVVGVYGLYKEGYRTDFDIWSDASATKMRNAYNAAAAVVAALTAKPTADVATNMAIIKANYTAFADANGALLTLKNEYPYYPKLTDADLYTDLLAKYDIAHTIDWTAASGSTGWTRAKDYRLDGDGHLNFRISTAEEWIELTNNPTFVSGYYAFPQRANDAMIQINALDGNHTVAFHVTDDIDFAAYDTIKPLKASSGNFIFNGHNNVFKNVDISVDVSTITADGPYRGVSNGSFTSVDGNNTTTQTMIGVGLIWFPSNNVFYMNFGVASGNINVTGATTLPVYVAPCVAYGNGNYGGIHGCWNGANVNVSATSTYNVIVSGLANFNRAHANIVNCLNLGTITKTSGDQKTYLAYHDVLGGGFDTNFLYNTKGVYGSVTDAANDTRLDANSGIAAQGVSVAELAYSVNKNFTTAPCLMNGNTGTGVMAYEDFFVNPNLKLDNSTVAYGTAADAVRKVSVLKCDSTGNGVEEPTVYGYFNGDAKGIALPTVEGEYTFNAEASGVTATANTFDMAGADVTLKYLASIVTDSGIQEVIEYWTQYNPDLFKTTAANKINGILDDANELLEKYEAGTLTATEVTDLQAASEALKGEESTFELKHEYPYLVPASEYAKYQKFGLDTVDANNKTIILLGVYSEADITALTTESVFTSGAGSDSGFLAVVKNKAGVRYRTYIANTHSVTDTADIASQYIGGGKWTVRYALMNDITLTKKLSRGLTLDNTAFLGYNHVISGIDLESTVDVAFFSGHNTTVMNVGLRGSIKTTGEGKFAAPVSGLGGENGRVLNSWFDIDLSGATTYGIANNIQIQNGNVINTAFIGTGATYVIEAETANTHNLKGIYYPAGTTYYNPAKALTESNTVTFTAEQLSSGELAYNLLNSAYKSATDAMTGYFGQPALYYTMANGELTFGNEANQVRKVAIKLTDAAGYEENSFTEYKNGNAANVALNAYDGYAISAADCVNATVDAGTYTLQGKDATLVYKSSSMGTSGAATILNKWKKYDLKYFDATSKAAIEQVMTTASTIISAGTTTEQEMSALDTADKALDPKLGFEYPNYIPFSQWELYEEFGLEDENDNNHIKFAIGTAEEAKYVMDNYYIGTFLNAAKTNDGSETLTAAYGGTVGWDQASKDPVVDGSYRVEFHMTADIDLGAYTGESKLTKNFDMQQTMFYGHKHVFKNIEIDLGTGSGGFFGNGNNCVIMDVGLANGTIKGATVASFRTGAQGWGSHIINSWSALDLTGTTAAYGFSSNIIQSRDLIENSAFVGTLDAPTVYLTSGRPGSGDGDGYTGAPAHTSAFYTDDYAWSPQHATGSGIIVSDNALETGELVYKMNKSDHEGYRDNKYTWDTVTKAYYTLDSNGDFVYSETDPGYCMIGMTGPVGTKTLYAKVGETISLNYSELPCNYQILTGNSHLTGEKMDQLTVVDDTNLTVTVTGVDTAALAAAVAQYNGLNKGYFVNSEGEANLAEKIAEAEAIIADTENEAGKEQAEINALATLIAEGYQLDTQYPNFPKVTEFDTYKNWGAVNFLVTDIDELNALAGKKASFTKDYTVHFAENVVIVVGAEDAAKNMSGMHANINGHGATIKGVTFSLAAADGTAAWLGVYGGSKISNLVLDSWNTTFTGWKSGVLIANSNVALTLENITIKDCTASYSANYGGFLLGDYNGSALTLTNITVEGSTMTHAAGNNGLLVGRVNTGTLTAENLYLNGNTITHTSGIAGGRGVIFGEENATTATISNVIVLNTTFGEGHVYTSGNVRMGVIVGRHKVNALTVRNAIVVLGDYKNQELPIINCDGIDSNGTVFNTPTYTLENIYSDAKYENYVTGNTATSYSLVESSNVIDTAKLLNGYATNALNLADGADIWTMVGNVADGYEPAFITGSEKATVAVSFTSDSWLAKQVAGDGGLTYTYYTDSTGKLIGVAEADVVALKKVDNWDDDDLDAAVLATYDAARTISGTYDGEEHTHSFATLTPNDDGVTHTGEDCTDENCPWYDEAIRCTESEYVHNGVTTYEGSMHTAKCACGRTMGEAEACKASATVVPGTEEPASCTEPGSKTYLCSKCYQNIEEEIPALDHDYDGVEWEPDSNNEGWHIRECARDCGDSQREECSYVEDESRREEPANGENGKKYLVCSECGHEKTEVILAPTSLKLTAPSTAYAGKSVKVKVELVSNPGLRSLNVTFGYDANIYELDEDGVISHIEATGVDIKIQDISDITVENGITWRTVAVATSGLWTDTDIMTVTFNVLDEASTGSTTIYTRVDEDEGAIGEGDENFKVEGAEVEIVVSNILLGDFNKTGELNMIDVVAMLRYHVYGANVFEDFEQNYDLEAFDYEEDGDADLNDVIAVMKYVNQKLNDKQAGK